MLTENFLKRINIPQGNFKVPLFCCNCLKETICICDTVYPNQPNQPNQQYKMRFLICLVCNAQTKNQSLTPGSASCLPNKEDKDLFTLEYSGDKIIALRYSHKEAIIKKVGVFKTIPEAYISIQNYFLL